MGAYKVFDGDFPDLMARPGPALGISDVGKMSGRIVSSFYCHPRGWS
jgi:hypothetical protein